MNSRVGFVGPKPNLKISLSKPVDINHFRWKDKKQRKKNNEKKTKAVQNRLLYMYNRSPFRPKCGVGIK